jgi:hypothetical protein
MATVALSTLASASCSGGGYLGTSTPVVLVPYRWLRKHCRFLDLVVHVGWPQWHCPYLVRFQFVVTDGHNWHYPLVLNSNSVAPMVTYDTVGVAMDQQPDLFGSFGSMLRPSAVDRIAGLFFQSSVGLRPYLSTVSLHRCLPVYCQAY